MLGDEVERWLTITLQTTFAISSPRICRSPGPRRARRSRPGRRTRRIGDLFLEDLPTHRTFALTGFGCNPITNAVHVEAVGAGADN